MRIPTRLSRRRTRSRPTLGLSHTTASVLVRRGLGDAPRPRGASSRRPRRTTRSQFGGMRRGGRPPCMRPRRARHADRRARRLRRRRRLLDGRCCVARCAPSAPTVRPRLPSRDEGYGLVARARRGAARAPAPALLITVDCGITATAEVARARALGMDVVVTDHHRPGAELPDCPIVHPARVRLSRADLCATGRRLQARAGAVRGGRARPGRARARARHRRARHGRRPRAAGAARTARSCAAACGRSPARARPGLRALMRVAGVDPQSVTEHDARLRARAADQRRRAPVPRRCRRSS